MFRKFVYFSLIIISPVISKEENPPKIIAGIKKSIIKRSLKYFRKFENKENFQNTSQNKNEIIVDLRNPSYRNGILVTHEGGIIKNKDLRIQAKSIQYIKREEAGRPVHKIEAEGDLMIQYKGKIFVGNELEYNFLTNEGVIYEGKTFSPPFYLGGDKIELRKDGSYSVKNVFLTTCENVNSSWDIYAESASVENRSLVKAKSVKFRIFRFPAFWLPYFKVNLKKFFQTPIIKYKLDWDKKSGPRGSMRYQLYSWKDFSFFARLDYRLKRGFGGALEAEFLPPDGRTKFLSQNYLATDIIPNDLTKKRRYRVQGELRTISKTKKTKVDITWDKYSDINMPSDFKTTDFELDTAKKTELDIRHERDKFITLVHARPRVNPFNTIKQDIPSLLFNFKPQTFGKSKITNSFFIKTAYLDFAYSDKLAVELKDFHSLRLQFYDELIRPFNLGPLNICPKIGGNAIFYSDIEKISKFFANFIYGGSCNFRFFKNLRKFRHVVEPYFIYEGMTHPNVSLEKHFIFSIQDGFHRLNMLRAGIKNQLFYYKEGQAAPSFEANLFSNIFFIDKTNKLTIPKMYLNFSWSFSKLMVDMQNGWNINKNRLDFTNMILGWTFSEDASIKLEFRHRSKYDFRKANHNNFIINVSEPENELADSPMSDRRDTILAKIFLRLNPFWSCFIQSHHGWDRKNEGPYHEVKVDLYTFISSSWKARISYQHTQKDDRFTGSITLVRK